jgi:hypothetical protein
MATITVPFIPTTSQVFAPIFQRRPERMLAMLAPGSATPFLYTAPSGRLALTPLPDKDARHHALERLRDFLLLVTFRREIAAGEPDGRAFRVKNIHDEMPDDVVDLQFPSIGFLPQPGPGVHESLGLGGPVILESTYGLYGPGTAVVRFGEYIEPFTIEVIAPKKATRRAVVAGLEVVLRMDITSGTLTLSLPDYFDALAEFELTGKLYIDDPYVAQNRRKVHLYTTLTVSDLWLAHGLARFQPSATVDVRTDLSVEVEVLSSVQQLAPELSAELVSQLVRG